MLSWNTTPMLARSESSVTSRRSTPSMRMMPASGSRRLEQGDRRALARAGGANQRDRLAGFHDEGQIVHGGAAAAIGQADPLELDAPLHPAQGHGVGLLDDRRRRIQHGEELGEPRRMKE